jgi:hypothetical protein
MSDFLSATRKTPAFLRLSARFAKPLVRQPAGLPRYMRFARSPHGRKSMPIYMPEERPRDLPPAGAHTAVCFRVIDLGTQQTPFGVKHQIYIGWELPDERMGNGQPFTIGRYYTYSSDERATLRGDIQGWLGRPLSNSDFGKFDLTTLLGTTCTLGVKHETKNDKMRAAIASVMRAAKGTPARLPLINDAVALSLNDRPFDFAAYEALPSWLRETVAKSPEYSAVNGSGALVATSTRDALDDEIPFVSCDPAVEPYLAKRRVVA